MNFRSREHSCNFATFCLFYPVLRLYALHRMLSHVAVLVDIRRGWYWRWIVLQEHSTAFASVTSILKSSLRTVPPLWSSFDGSVSLSDPISCLCSPWALYATSWAASWYMLYCEDASFGNRGRPRAPLSFAPVSLFMSNFHVHFKLWEWFFCTQSYFVVLSSGADSAYLWHSLIVFITPAADTLRGFLSQIEDQDDSNAMKLSPVQFVLNFQAFLLETLR